MKLSLVCFLLAGIAFIHAAEPLSAPSSGEAGVFRQVLRRQGDDGVHTYRIPGLATSTAGTLLAVFDLRHQHAGDLPADIDVGLMRSTDDGKTWSPMQRIMDFDRTVPGSQGNGVGDPSILVDAKTGTIWVAALYSKGNRSWHGSGPGLSEEESGQFLLVKSTDDGLTWSAPINITAQVKNPAWHLCFQGPGNGICLRNGTLVLPAQYRDDKKVAHSCFIASTDGGATWRISPAAVPQGSPTSEAAVVELSDGALLLSMRNESRAGQRLWARWEWTGDIWKGQWGEPWLAVTDPTCMASMVRHPSGELVFSNPNSAQKREALTVRVSKDDGKTWSPGRVLDPQAAWYSSLTVLKDGRIGILYETGLKTLTFARFPLDWVVGP